MEESKKELFEALFAAQAEFPKIKRDSKNPHFKSKYASLAGAAEQLEPILRNHNLMITQPAAGNGIGTGCTTILAHIPTGQSIQETLLLPSAGPGTAANAQTGTAAITYAKRTAYISIVGAIVEEDDDGNRAVGRESSTKRTETKAAKEPVKKADTKPAAAPASSTKQKTSEAPKVDKKADKSAAKKSAPVETEAKAGPGVEPATIPTELPGTTAAPATTTEPSCYMNAEEYAEFRVRAQVVKDKLGKAGVAEPGKKLMALFMKKTNVDEMKKIPKLTLNVLLQKMEKMVDDPKLLPQAVVFVNRGY